MMRIAFVTPLVSRKAGGLFVSVRQLAQSLSLEPGIQLRVFGAADSHIEEDRTAWTEVDLRTLPMRGPAALVYMPALIEELKAFSPDLIHVHGLWTSVSKLSNDYCRASGTPHVISPRGCLDSWALSRSRLKKQLALWVYERSHLRTAGVMHALADSEYRSIREFGLNNPVAILPNGIHVAERQAAPPPLWLQNILTRGKRVLLFLGRINPKKGIVNLIRGAGLLKQSGFTPLNNWQFVIAGWDEAGHLAEIRKAILDAGLDDSMTLPGSLHGQEKEATFGNVHGFVLPSFSEGLPMAVLEAWSWRLPTLITPACNLPIGFEQEATIKIDTDPSQIADGLKRLFTMTDGERAALGERAFHLVNAKFSWRQIAPEMVRVYQWAATPKSPPPACIRMG